MRALPLIRRSFRVSIPLLLTFAVATAATARVLTSRSPALPEGASWTVLELGPGAWPALPADLESRILWDLRPVDRPARAVRWTVRSPEAAGLAGVAGRVGADRALCGEERADGSAVGCRLFRDEQTGPAGPRLLWSERAGDAAGQPAGGDAPGRGDLLTAGDAYRDTLRASDGSLLDIRGKVVAEGVLLVPAGPQEVILLRERIDDGGGSVRLRYRFLTASGLAAATLEGAWPVSGRPFVPDAGNVLASTEAAVDDGITIGYQELSDALVPGNTGFLQYGTVKGFCSGAGPERCNLDSQCPSGETCTDTTTLADIHPGWTSVAEMIGVDRSGDVYQPDPGDPGSSQTLGEIWDFGPLVQGNMPYRTFNSTRNDLAGAACPEVCAVRDNGATPADGTWQYYLKIDTYDPGGTLFTRDSFMLNDNDTGANPAIDLPYVSQDELNRDDWTQICSQDSGGGANRLVHFFQFFGADPASAVLQRDDTWTSGAWTSCHPDTGLHVTLASQCDPQCYPTCDTPPYARGLLGDGAGLSSTIIEDGWIKTSSGNYLPSLLMRQVTDLEAGIDFGFVCFLGRTRTYSIDYFWIHRHYGLLASISSPTDDSGTMPPDDWSLFGNITDGVDITFGPFPPQQTGAQACLSGTRVEWALPDDDTNLSGEPGISNYGYVVSWGTQSDPEELADWTANPDHSPLPGEAGFLAAPVGSEPTSYVIDSFGGATINVTVTTALQYTDPDVADTVSYRSAAFYKVVEDPARLDAGTFQVGNSVAPFVTKNGADLDLAWPAVDGAAAYRLRVWDLTTRTEIACPAGLDCNPAAPTTTHTGGASDGNSYGYRAFAVDACGEESAN